MTIASREVLVRPAHLDDAPMDLFRRAIDHEGAAQLVARSPGILGSLADTTSDARKGFKSGFNSGTSVDANAMPQAASSSELGSGKFFSKLKFKSKKKPLPFEVSPFPPRAPNLTWEEKVRISQAKKAADLASIANVRQRLVDNYGAYGLDYVIPGVPLELGTARGLAKEFLSQRKGEDSLHSYGSDGLSSRSLRPDNEAAIVDALQKGAIIMWFPKRSPNPYGLVSDECFCYRTLLLLLTPPLRFASSSPCEAGPPCLDMQVPLLVSLCNAKAPDKSHLCSASIGVCHQTSGLLPQPITLFNALLRGN